MSVVNKFYCIYGLPILKFVVSPVLELQSPVARLQIRRGSPDNSEIIFHISE